MSEYILNLRLNFKNLREDLHMLKEKLKETSISIPVKINVSEVKQQIRKLNEKGGIALKVDVEINKNSINEKIARLNKSKTLRGLEVPMDVKLENIDKIKSHARDIGNTLRRHLIAGAKVGVSGLFGGATVTAGGVGADASGFVRGGPLFSIVTRARRTTPDSPDSLKAIGYRTALQFTRSIAWQLLEVFGITQAIIGIGNFVKQSFAKSLELRKEATVGDILLQRTGFKGDPRKIAAFSRQLALDYDVGSIVEARKLLNFAVLQTRSIDEAMSKVIFALNVKTATGGAVDPLSFLKALERGEADQLTAFLRQVGSLNSQIARLVKEGNIDAALAELQRWTKGLARSADEAEGAFGDLKDRLEDLSHVVGETAVFAFEYWAKKVFGSQTFVEKKMEERANILLQSGNKQAGAVLSAISGGPVFGSYFAKIPAEKMREFVGNLIEFSNKNLPKSAEPLKEFLFTNRFDAARRYKSTLDTADVWFMGLDGSEAARKIRDSNASFAHILFRQLPELEKKAESGEISQQEVLRIKEVLYTALLRKVSKSIEIIGQTAPGMLNEDFLKSMLGAVSPSGIDFSKKSDDFESRPIRMQDYQAPTRALFMQPQAQRDISVNLTVRRADTNVGYVSGARF